MILGHGIVGSGVELLEIRRKFTTRGWSEEDIFAITYGPGAPSNINFLSFTLKCDYVQKVSNCGFEEGTISTQVGVNR